MGDRYKDALRRMLTPPKPQQPCPLAKLVENKGYHSPELFPHARLTAGEYSLQAQSMGFVQGSDLRPDAQWDDKLGVWRKIHRQPKALGLERRKYITRYEPVMTAAQAKGLRK